MQFRELIIGFIPLRKIADLLGIAYKAVLGIPESVEHAHAAYQLRSCSTGTGTPISQAAAELSPTKPSQAKHGNHKIAINPRLATGMQHVHVYPVSEMVSLPTMNRLPTCFARQRSLCVNTGIGRCKTCFTRSNLTAELDRLPCVVPHLLTWSQSLPRRPAKAKATKFGAKSCGQVCAFMVFW